ncbi:MAG TPA: hypothetical protein VH502_13990 [Actinoplanes sp.]|jgi:hypothetical protein
MDAVINGILLLVVLALPITIVLVVRWVARRRGMSTRHERPDEIDYDKW